MTSGKKTIEEIWREINQEPCTRVDKIIRFGDVLNKGRFVVNPPGILPDAVYSPVGSISTDLHHPSNLTLDNDASNNLVCNQFWSLRRLSGSWFMTAKFRDLGGKHSAANQLPW